MTMFRRYAFPEGVFCRTAVDPRVAVGVACDPESDRTRQSERDACDVNRIVRMYGGMDRAAMFTARPAAFADVSEIGDFRSQLQRMRQLEESFMALPSAVRARFRNDPAQLLDFIVDPANVDDVRQLRLFPDDHPVFGIPKGGPVKPAEPAPAQSAGAGGKPAGGPS